MTITLTPELEQALSERAKRQGTTPEVLAIDVLRQELVPAEEPPSRPKSLADLLEGHIGVLNSSEHVPGGARMSEDCGKKFAEGLLSEHRQARP